MSPSPTIPSYRANLGNNCFAITNPIISRKKLIYSDGPYHSYFINSAKAFWTLPKEGFWIEWVEQNGREQESKWTFEITVQNIYREAEPCQSTGQPNQITIENGKRLLTPGTPHNSQNGFYFSLISFIPPLVAILTGHCSFHLQMHTSCKPSINRITPRSLSHLVTGVSPIIIITQTYVNLALSKTKVGSCLSLPSH